MKFIDEVVISVKAGHGGAGSRSFRREKHVPLGGPNGGNGGRGGDVILLADNSKQTLIDFTFEPNWLAKNGQPGSGQLKDGSAGDDLIIRVPPGTQVFNNEDQSLIIDLNEPGQQFILAKGGRGGKGNNFFKSSTNQAPQHAQPGEDGEEGAFRLSLKLLADVALVGMPNAGKSTLIARISAAKPKIADYPFTTLSPNLGVVKYDNTFSFVVADIPGLIPGAHQGRGLGIEFLKHIERTNLILHLLDCSEISLSEDSELTQQQLLENFKAINEELRFFSEDLANKPQLVLLTKVDAISNQSALNVIRDSILAMHFEVHTISSASGLGINELLHKVAQLLKIQKGILPSAETIVKLV